MAWWRYYLWFCQTFPIGNSKIDDQYHISESTIILCIWTLHDNVWRQLIYSPFSICIGWNTNDSGRLSYWKRCLRQIWRDCRCRTSGLLYLPRILFLWSESINHCFLLLFSGNFILFVCPERKQTVWLVSLWCVLCFGILVSFLCIHRNWNIVPSRAHRKRKDIRMCAASLKPCYCCRVVRLLYPCVSPLLYGTIQL